MDGNFSISEKSVDKNIVDKNVYIDSSQNRSKARNNAIENSCFADCISSANKSNQLPSNLEPDPQNSIFKSFKQKNPNPISIVQININWIRYKFYFLSEIIYKF